MHVFTQAGNRQGEAAQLSNIGNIYFEQGRLDEALKAFGDALHVFQLIGHRQGEAQSLGNIGLVYRKKGEQARALEALQQAHAAYVEIGVRSEGWRTVEAAIGAIEGR